jgi:hypothetical protein
LVETRRRWKEECYKYVSRMEPSTLRPKMLEVLHACFKEEGGEFACMGNFLKGWAEKLEDGCPFSDRDARAMKRMMRIVVFGARGVMREYARLKNVAKGDAKELRRISINKFISPPPTVRKENKKIRKVSTLAGSPHINCWRMQGTGALRKAMWEGPTAPPAGQEETIEGSKGDTLEERLQRAITRAVRPQPWAPWGGRRRKADSRGVGKSQA